MKNADGLYTGALFGFLNLYLKYADELKPAYVGVAFDRKEPTFRHRAYAAYKGTRKPMPEELAVQMPVLKELLDAMRIGRIELAGYEADDVLGTFARLAKKQPQLRTVILTGDRDALQLIDEMTQVMLLTSKPGQSTGVLYDIEAVQARYGVMPRALIEVKALMGDASDNIPGVPGVGEKTALGLIAEYGSLDAVYAHLPEIKKPALCAKLTENRESAYLSRKLGEIFTEVPVTATVPELAVKPYDIEALSALLDRLEFRSMRKRLCGDALPAAEAEASVKAETPSEEGLSLFSYLETEQETPQSPEQPLSEWIAAKPDTVYVYVPSGPEDGGLAFDLLAEDGDARVRITAAESRKALESLRPLLEDETIRKILFCAKPFWRWCMEFGCEPKGLACDLTVASYLLDSTRKSDDFLQVCRYLLGKNVLPGVSALREAFPAAMEKLEQANLIKLYREIELPLIPVLARMERCGFRVDRKILQAEGARLDKRIQELTEEIYKLAGKTFNINSTRQLGTVLFEEMGLPGQKKTKTGYSTDSDVLEKLADQHPIVPKIIEYRQNAKLKSTYIDGLLNVVHPEEERVYSTFHQTVTATGRLSSSEPNLQNIPVRSELGKRIRTAFVPSEPGHVLIDADYSQIELRVMAAMAGDEAMMQAFREEADIHTRTAAEVGGIPVSMVTPEMRARAKAVNFGIVYGISEFGLARDLGISRFEAKNYIERYFARYPRIRTFTEELITQAREKGYAETLFGRRRLLPELTASKYMTRQFGERVAMNMPVQGTAADIIKLAMVRIDRALSEGGYRAKLILQVHDELLIDAPAVERDAVIPLLREAMENACTLPVPLKAQVSVSEVSWYYCK